MVLSSFNPLVLRRLKKLDPEVRTALIFMDTNWNPELLAEIKPEDRVDLPWPLRQEWIRRAIRKLVKPDLLSINHEVDEGVLDRLIAKGWPVFIWTPDEDSRPAAGVRQAAVRSDLGPADSGEADSGRVALPWPGGTFTDEVEESGVELYECCIHPWMRAVVTARE